jgi:hypothetical protein
LPFGKDIAPAYVRQKLGVKSMVVAGDSGNDLHLLLIDDPLTTAVLVGGAESGLVSKIKTEIDTLAQNRVSESLYLLPNGKRYYFPQDSQRKGPESILQALIELKKIGGI